MRKRGRTAFTISNVASTYHIHPQTLRLYERQGLLKPSRSEGNTRLYADQDLVRLELILNLTRDLGVNLAGVEIILNMREKMEEMQNEIRDFMRQVKREFAIQSPRFRSRTENALVRTPPPKIVRLNR
jgi:MerR family transcriptional regulator, heat shock protein HspR